MHAKIKCRDAKNKSKCYGSFLIMEQPSSTLAIGDLEIITEACTYTAEVGMRSKIMIMLNQARLPESGLFEMCNSMLG